MATRQRAVEVLLGALATVPDRRVARTRAHKLVDLLAIALLTLINGGKGWEDMEEFASDRQGWLRGFLELPGGAPSADTFRRVFEALRPSEFSAALAIIVKDLVADLDGKVVAIDGKTLRGSFRDRTGTSALHVVSAWVVEEALSLGALTVEAKENEITAIPELVKLLDLDGATVTIDAMGCQKAIAAAIVERNADYLLALKDNHPTLCTEVQGLFAKLEELEFDDASIDVCEVTSKRAHGRVERRTVFVTSDLGALTSVNGWSNLRSVAMVRREREVNGSRSVEDAYYLTSLEPDAATIEKRVRSHWGIENTLHWTLDVVLGEDASRVRSRNGATNLASLRKLTVSLLKREMSQGVKSMARKQKRAGWVPDYAFDILRGISAE